MAFNFAEAKGPQRMPDDEMLAYIKQKLPGKAAMYDYLVNYAGRYLMPYNQCKLDFLFDILMGTRKTISCSDVVKMPCPRYQELSLKQLIAHINEGDPELATYFPEGLSEKTKLSREWAYTIVASKRPDFMRQIIDHAQNARMNRTKTDQAMVSNLHVCDEFVALLQQRPYVAKRRGRIMRMLTAKVNKGKPRKVPQKVNWLGSLKDYHQQCAAQSQMEQV